MAYRAYLGKILEGKQRAYVDAHRAVWPDLIHAMRRAGVTRESCFVLDQCVIVYVEAADIDATMKKLAKDPINQKWDAFMESILEPPMDGSPDFFPEMEEVFKM